MNRAPFYLDGRPITLGARLGGGGEGDVYEVEEYPSQAVKLYKFDAAASREAKIRFMIVQKLAQKAGAMVAFPQGIVTDRDKRFCGFSMRKATGCLPVHMLYSPKSRRQKFPDKDYRFLVHTALNIVRAIASVHKAGCVIGDINHSGVLISQNGLAVLIDTDSFQMDDGARLYHCQVGVEDYTAPELQGQSLSNVRRTENHDCFGLAVLIFHLLFMGRHPFAGTDPRDVNKALGDQIRDYQFSYSLETPVVNLPPPHSLRLRDFPLEIQKGFESAFGMKKSGYFNRRAPLPPKRPSALDWVQWLGAFQASLISCRVSPLHYYAKGAHGCPWCRIKRESGLDYFGAYTPRPKPANYVQSLEQAAQAKNAKAQCALGLRYLEGKGVPENHPTAFFLLEEADKQGSKEAGFNLGVIYYHGIGTAPDLKRARQYFEKTALRGDLDAAYNAGVMLYKGEGGKPDPKQAKKYLKKAAVKGHSQAKKMLESLF